MLSVNSIYYQKCSCYYDYYSSFTFKLTSYSFFLYWTSDIEETRRDYDKNRLDGRTWQFFQQLEFTFFTSIVNQKCPIVIPTCQFGNISIELLSSRAWLKLTLSPNDSMEGNVCFSKMSSSTYTLVLPFLVGY